MMLNTILPHMPTVVATLFLAIFPTLVFSQTDIVWSEPIVVASSTYGASSPKLAVLPGGEVLAVWGKSGAGPKIYFSRKTGDSFEAPVELNTGGIVPDIYGFGGLDMTVFGEKVFVVFENFNSGVHLLRSEDGGQTFLPPTSVFDPPAGDWTTLATLTVDWQGNPIVSVIRQLANETEARYIVVRSTDGGASFLPPVIGSEPADGEHVCECCPSDMVASGDSVWLVFRNNDNNQRDVWVSRCTDQSATFDAATDVDETDWLVSACPVSGPRLQRIANDSLLAVWMSGASGQGRIYGATLHSGTMEKGWQFNFPATNTNSLQSFPSIAGSGDTLCVIWEESGFGGNAGELIYGFSTTGASGLSQYELTNLTQAPGNQKYPDLSFADGFFHLVYQTVGALVYRRGPLAIINGISEVPARSPGFELLANPVLGVVLVKMQTSGPSRFSLLNSLGQPIQHWPLDAVSLGTTSQLRLASGIPAGLYYLKMEKDGTVWTEKLMVK